MLATTFFRKSSQQQQDNVEREVSEAAESLSQLLRIAELRTNSHHHHVPKNAETERTIGKAIQKLEVLQRRLDRHKEIVDLIQVFENEIAKKTEESKKRECELEQWIVQANMQRVTLLTQRDEIANQLAVMKRKLQAEDNTDTRGEGRNLRIAKLCDGDWDDALDIDEDA